MCVREIERGREREREGWRDRKREREKRPTARPPARRGRPPSRSPHADAGDCHALAAPPTGTRRRVCCAHRGHHVRGRDIGLDTLQGDATGAWTHSKGTRPGPVQTLRDAMVERSCPCVFHRTGTRSATLTRSSSAVAAAHTTAQRPAAARLHSAAVAATDGRTHGTRGCRTAPSAFSRTAKAARSSSNCPILSVSSEISPRSCSCAVEGSLSLQRNSTHGEIRPMQLVLSRSL